MYLNGLTVKMPFEGKTCRKLANGQDIDYSKKKKKKKKKTPVASSAFILEIFSIIFKHVCWYKQQISGERLQDHWSSGFHILLQNNSADCKGFLF